MGDDVVEMGLLAEYADSHGLARGLRRARELGIEQIDGYMPYSEEDAYEAVAPWRPKVSWWALAGGLLGGGGAYGLQWWLAARAYPLDVGGRPLDSGPAFVPIAVELTILLAALGTFAAFLWTCALPRPYHPVFEIEGFERATNDGFFLTIARADPRLDASVAEELRRVGAVAVRPWLRRARPEEREG